MRQFIVWMIFYVKFHFVTNARANEASRNRSPKCPIGVFYTINHFAFLFFNLHVNNELRSSAVAYWFGHKRWSCKFGFHLSFYFYIFIILSVFFFLFCARKQTDSYNCREDNICNFLMIFKHNCILFGLYTLIRHTNIKE